jgi:hypothetical protein
MVLKAESHKLYYVADEVATEKYTCLQYPAHQADIKQVLHQ